ncbi:MAG: VWA domain-containing protein [Polyangiaceae bacterium]|nr:VWA domain-containing protein [Polyangiaceae bacterium]
MALTLGALPLVWVELVWTRLVPEVLVRVERPWVAAVTAVAVLVVCARLTRLSPRTHPARRALVEALLSAAALTAGLAAMGFQLGRPIDKLAVILVVDRSRSIDLVPDADARLRAELEVVERGMRGDDRIALIAFGADAMVEDPLRPKSAQKSVARAEVGRDASDLAAAIKRALAEVPEDAAPRIVLLSDGVETRGDAVLAAAAAVAAEVPIDVVPLDQAQVPDVRVVALRVPPRVDEKEPLDLRIVTSSAVEAEVELRVLRDGVPIKKGTAKIQAGEDVLRIREIAPAPGMHRYDVEVTAKDPRVDQAPEDNSASAFVRVRGPAIALILEGEPGKATFIERALLDAGYRTEVRGPSGFPADLAGLVGFDLVVLSDVRASEVSASQLDSLAGWVRELGGGLVLMGGDRSMGPGGYAKTSIEEVSPVSFDLKQERRRASLAEVISIDYSGSMGARVGPYTKLDLANEASARSALLLGPGDRLGVAHVDTVNKWTVPLGPVVDTAAIARAIKAVKVGGGGIYVDLALDEAYRALDAEKVNLRHLLLFADGDDAERMGGCRAKVSSALSRGITTSVVALGKGSDVAELEVLARLGNGRYYLIEDATRLPAVFTQETILASRSSIHEIDFRPTLGAPGAAIRAIDFGAAPILKGYVVTIAKPRASVHLVGPEGDPLLATWSVGMGRAAAFTSDLKDRWGAAWTTFPGAARMMAQLARDTSRRPDDPRVRLEADTAGGELHVRATVVGDDGRAQSFRRLAISVAGPEGFAKRVPLEPVGSGAYAASVPLSRPGTYVATAVDELSRETVGTAGAVLSPGEELRPTGTDRALLSRLASMTGGRPRSTLAGLFLDRAPPRYAYDPIGGWLALAAGVLLLLSVAVRKLALTLPAARASVAPARPARAPRPAETTSRPAPVVERSLRPAPVAAPSAPATGGDQGEPKPPSLRAPKKAARAPTAAEILLEKRRGRQRGEGG